MYKPNTDSPQNYEANDFLVSSSEITMKVNGEIRLVIHISLTLHASFQKLGQLTSWVSQSTSAYDGPGTGLNPRDTKKKQKAKKSKNSPLAPRRIRSIQDPGRAEGR